MKTEDAEKFFEALGEIWRDVSLLEFLMRCAIAKHDGDISSFPTPPYTRGKIYNDYPRSFSHYNIETIFEKYRKRFPEIIIPKEIIELRHAMAHGVIAEINYSGVDELIKFKEIDNKLQIEFSLSLELERLVEIRKGLSLLRRQVAATAAD